METTLDKNSSQGGGTSREPRVATSAFVSGMIVAFGGDESTASTVAGCILQGAAVLGYLFAEGLADAANVGAQEGKNE